MYVHHIHIYSPGHNYWHPSQPGGAVEYINCISAKGLDPLCNECFGYDTKQSDSKAPALEIWGMSSTPSLPLLPDPLWPRVVAPDSVLSMGQIVELFDYLNWVQTNDWCLIELLVIHSNTLNHLIVCKWMDSVE